MFEELERRRAEVERHRENSARLAQAFAKFETTGQGFVEFEDVIDFGLTFIEEPYPTFGSAIDLDALADLQNLEPDNQDQVKVPLISGYVTEWDQDDRDFYVGAWVGVRVHFPPGDAILSSLEVVANHFFTFTGIAIKDVPVDVRD